MFIERMREAHIKEVQHIAHVAWAYTYDGIIPKTIQENFLRKAYSDEMMLRRLQTNIFIASIGDKVVGFANYSKVKENGVVELAAIYLLPDYHGQGIGTALLKEGEKLKGAVAIECNVEKLNTIGFQFYKAKDFVIMGEFEELFEDHVLQTVRLRKYIKAAK